MPEVTNEFPARSSIARGLVVEDNLIIAMDNEDHLRGLGVAEVVIAGSVHAALKHLAGDRFDIALLDYNLGDETSDPIAERLATLGVPFWFVTGYGDAIAKRAGAKANGVLRKPVTAQDLETLLEQLPHG